MQHQRKKFAPEPRSETGLTRHRKRYAAIALSVSLLVGCSAGNAVSPAASSGHEMQRYALNGKVVAINIVSHKVTIAHDDIPNYMEAMTMPFTLLDDAKLRELKRGDDVKATLVFDEQTNRSWLEEVVVTETQKQGAGQTAAMQ